MLNEKFRTYLKFSMGIHLETVRDTLAAAATRNEEVTVDDVLDEAVKNFEIQKQEFDEYIETTDPEPMTIDIKNAREISGTCVGNDCIQIP